MSPEALTADRVYKSLKHLILTGEFRPGSTIGLTGVADRFETSISPVRDALQRLVGERLVDLSAGGGFAMPEVTEEKVGNLYAWHSDLIRLAIKTVNIHEVIEAIDAEDRGASHGDLNPEVLARSMSLFAQIARCSTNPEYLSALLAVADRLSTIRIYEHLIFRTDAEFDTLLNIVRSGDRTAIRAAMWQYHRRRLSKAGELSRAAGGRSR